MPNRRPYVIHTQPYTNASAGVRFFYLLQHELIERGYECFSINPTNPAWNHPTITPEEARALPGAVMVYDGGYVTGNPHGMERVVRWLGNPVGYFRDNYGVADTDLVYVWESRAMTDAPCLTLDVIEHDLFNGDDLPPKDVDCVYYGKGRFRLPYRVTADEFRAMFPPPPNTVEITRDWPSTRRVLAELLRRTHTLYTYDDDTMLHSEALCCGCKVVILPDDPCVSHAIHDDVITADHEGRLLSFIERTQGEW